ncbi:MAG: hypothetical protein AVDCRST_MAG59-5378 [uncultured Thermomicrobiales bacterium]|jgi:hypothetical protein|uniref:Uncharacterized protein n=1 Tax=uncultured Thermomicrobiales bacterium TaxID=1645740 RepID=A0A6J4VPB6_9BACT|nr:MAG: hypothetical protein AVDCRST_MAG59-5378 [uncultured Thermomicrobiales bacterium]
MIEREGTTTTGEAVPFRWECGCRETPVLLGTYEADGRINLKSRDRYWHVYGRVETHCPRCGAERVLDLDLAPDHGAPSSAPRPARSA